MGYRSRMVRIRPVLSAFLSLSFVAAALLAALRDDPAERDVASVLRETWSPAALVGVVEITIRTRFGSELRRVFDVDHEGDTWVIEALEPTDIEGVRFVLGPDHREVYLPAVDATVRIASGPTGRFVGSDLTFEDLAVLERFPAVRTVEEVGDDWLLTSGPAGSYTAVRTRVRRSDLAVLEVELVDEAGPAKRIEVLEAVLVHGHFTPMDVVVRDLRRETFTHFVVR